MQNSDLASCDGVPDSIVPSPIWNDQTAGPVERLPTQIPRNNIVTNLSGSDVNFKYTKNHIRTKKKGFSFWLGVSPGGHGDGRAGVPDGKGEKNSDPPRAREQ